MDFLHFLFTNPIILSAFFSSLAAQLIKSAIAWRKKGAFHWRYLFLAAGMPSAHTATVTALTLGIYLTEGLGTLLVASGVFAFIVIRDVIGDKAFAQQQEDMVNDIFEKLGQGKFEAISWNTLIGHSLKEVFAGFLLGIFITLIIFNI